MAELTLEENVRQMLPTLPLPVQKFFEQRKLGEVSRSLMERYALHIDQGAVLERELMLALLGIEGPDELAAALYEELPVSKQTVIDIINDINQEVFLPLREEMRKGTAAPAKPVVPQPVRQAVPQPQQQRPRPMMQPPRPPQPVPARQTAQMAGNEPFRPKPPQPAEPEHHFHLENKIPPPPNPRRLLEDHEEPHIKISNTAPVANKSSFAPPNLPGRIEHPPLPTPPQPPAPKPIQPASPITPASPKATRAPWETSQGAAQGAAPTPPAPPKQYSSDPYREPLGP